ncbi:HIT domain-containing protein [Candidatus Woesearchaeota archaeon]|nr:HIT domain-containing protein [Candidatus Woesearchaeota archaeon]
MENCIFCKIVKGEIESYPIYEDEEFMAFLTPFPNMKGLTVVIPKKHTDSYIFNQDDESYCRFLKIVKKIGKQLDKKLNVARCALVFEGTGINHLHAKLYPLHGKLAYQTNVWAKERVYFKNYEGYVTTLEGPEADKKELKELAKLLSFK